MTLREAYDALGGDYEAALAYLRNDRLVERLLLKFLDDTACPRLFAAWDSGDLEGAFAAAHEAKGVCANLYLTHLGAIVSQVTELLRADGHRDLQFVGAQVNKAKDAYELATQTIASYAAGR